MNAHFAVAIELLDADAIEHMQHRAAMLEYYAEIERDEAERLAALEAMLSQV